MLILVVNCGSSSAKYDLFDVEKEVSICRGAIERIGDEESTLTHEISDNGKTKKEVSCPDHHKAIEIIRDAVCSSEYGMTCDVRDIIGVGHRVVHGGEEFNESILIDERVIKSIEKFSDLAPLHNPPALEGIRGCMKNFEGVPQVAVFDTAFHQTMPEHVYCYGIPYEYYRINGVRKYGFHGTSHRYVSAKAAEAIGRPKEELNIITVHLGNGCSIAAVKCGKSVDTSMGFTPLEGLLMGTRSGDIDPAIISYLMNIEGKTAEEVTEILNKKSGLLGVSGVSNDMRDILKSMAGGDERARLAYNIFVYRIKKYIGSYAAVLGRVDAVVFTAGIGENVPAIKESIQEDLSGLMAGAEFMTIGTDEELLIAKDTYSIVKSC